MTQIIKTSITDIPKRAQEKDTFGIEPYEKGLIRFIENTNTPITISLQGEWGSGKTSLMNSLKKNLCDKDCRKFHSIWLNTWEYALMKDTQTTLIDIITGLIKETSKIAKVDDSTAKKLLAKVGMFGKVAAKIATKTAVDQVARGSGGEVADAIFSEKGNSTIAEIRNELETIIDDCIKKDNKEGFIFFIDDLDRIDPPVAVELLELLKNIFTLESCVFILAIDYDVIIKGLEPKFGKFTEANEREFRSFFDKIIQVPFSMPVTSYKIDSFLKESLININYLTAEHCKNKELIKRITEFANLSVGTNPRALKRLLNSLSLISCINVAKEHNEEDDQLNEELELLVNFALVSIQIAYPLVYKLLTLHSDFGNWNEKVAIQMNLKELDNNSKEKLKQSEEFDEEWEQVLFRLCENDYYLKKKALNISRLLNGLKIYIMEKNESVEDTIDYVISLSSVTNLEAFDKPVVDYHRGNLLKNIRWKLLPLLQNKLPDIAHNIQQQGRRVQTNAFIKFTEKDWGDWIRLSSHPYEGAIRLIISTDKWLCPAKHSDFRKCLSETGELENFEKIETDFNSFIEKYSDFTALKLCDLMSCDNNIFKINMYIYLIQPNIESFYKENNILAMSDIIVELYKFMQKLNILYNKTLEFYEKK